ncbi:MAG: type I-B CRISPR-associated protein Cas7/Cst2/DevR [candidate division WOR-3 bacterium]
MNKAISIGYLFKVSAGNVNASHSEGNVIVAKKVTLPDGNTLPYISGQALRRALRDRIEELGWALSEPHSEVKGQEVTPPCRPWEFIDEDLFGYMDASGGKRRTSPVRVSFATGCFPFRGDRDLGTRSFEKFGQAVSEGGNMFETEVYNNIFRGVIMVELDRVGVFGTLETGEKEIKELTAPEKSKRVTALLEALRILWGGGRTARMIVDLSPKFLAYARMKAKHPVFLESLLVDEEFNLNLPLLQESLERMKDYIEVSFFGMETGFFNNEKDIKEAFGDKVMSIAAAIDKAKEDTGKVYAGS